MIIPTGETYTTAVQGGMWKHVACQRCGSLYSYYMSRVGVGQGSNPLWLNTQGAISESARASHANLHYRLISEPDPAPCPVRLVPGRHGSMDA